VSTVSSSALSFLDEDSDQEIGQIWEAVPDGTPIEILGGDSQR
jgi:hypothetical protein